MWESRVAPLSGLMFVLLLIAGSLVINNFDFMPPQEEIAAFYADQSARIMAGGYMGLLSSFFLLWFAGSLREALRRDEKGSDRLATLAFGGGVIVSTMVALSYMTTFYGAERAGIQGSIDPGGAAALFDLASGMVGAVAPFGMAAMAGAYGIVSLRSGNRPAWAGWISLIIAAGLISPVNWLVIAFGVLWVGVVGVGLYRENVAAGSAPEHADSLV